MILFYLSRAWDKVLQHRNAESEGLRFDSSWGLRIFSLSYARDKTKKHLSLFSYRAQNLPSLLFFLILSSSNLEMSESPPPPIPTMTL